MGLQGAASASTGDHGERPPPLVRLSRDRVMRSDAPAKNGNERRSRDQNDVAPEDRATRVHMRVDVTLHAAGPGNRLTRKRDDRVCPVGRVGVAGPDRIARSRSDNRNEGENRDEGCKRRERDR